MEEGSLRALLASLECTLVGRQLGRTNVVVVSMLVQTSAEDLVLAGADYLGTVAENAQ